VGPQRIMKPNDHEWVGAGVVKNILPTASSQTGVRDSSSSSAVVDTQLPPLILLQRKERCRDHSI
jgi:hypothetical protein